jgi:bla regulator protein blaR1
MRVAFIGNWLPGEWLRAICLTLMHSLWQGLVAAVIAAVIIATTRKAGAALRYNLLSAVVLLFLGALSITFYFEITTGVPAASGTFALPASEGLYPAIASDALASVQSPKGNMIAALVEFIGEHSAPIVLAWFLFFIFKCLRVFAGLSGISRIRRSESEALPAEWISRLQELAGRLGIDKSVRVLQSRMVKVPVAVGFFKPVIFIPLGLLAQLPAAQVETILLHELAHIRRNDFAINLIQRIIEALLFFNPGILWISSLLRREREAACDDIVVANTAHRETYLEALISFQERQLSASTFAMALGTRRNYLLNRVRRMLTRENEKLNVMEKVFLFAGLAVMTAFTFLPAKPAGLTAPDLPVAVIKRDAAVLVFASDVKPLPPVRKAKSTTRSHEQNVADTVPSKTTPSELDDLKIDGLSNYVNDDGTNRTEVVTVTDDKGKKYVITKANNKMTDFTIDGKSVPEGERANYTGFFQKVELAAQMRKDNMQHRMQDRQLQLKEKQRERERWQIEMKAEQKRRMDDHERNMEMNMQSRQQKMKLLEADRERRDEERRQEQRHEHDVQALDREKLYRQGDERREQDEKNKMDRQIRQEKQREHEFQLRERKQSEQQRDRSEQLRDRQKMEMKFRKDTTGRLENKKRLFDRQSELKKESFLNDARSDRSIFTKKMQWQRKNIELEKKKLLQDRRVI